MSDYTNLGTYLLTMADGKFPDGVKDITLGEGRNKGTLKDGRSWMKNCFMGPEEMIAAVNAHNAMTARLISAEEMRALMPKAVVEPKEIEP